MYPCSKKKELLNKEQTKKSPYNSWSTHYMKTFWNQTYDWLRHPCSIKRNYCNFWIYIWTIFAIRYVNFEKKFFQYYIHTYAHIWRNCIFLTAISILPYYFGMGLLRSFVTHLNSLLITFMWPLPVRTLKQHILTHVIFTSIIGIHP